MYPGVLASHSVTTSSTASLHIHASVVRAITQTGYHHSTNSSSKYSAEKYVAVLRCGEAIPRFINTCCATVYCVINVCWPTVCIDHAIQLHWSVPRPRP